MSVANMKKIVRRFWNWIKMMPDQRQAVRVDKGIEEDRLKAKRPPPLDKPRKM